jgi:tripartite ATP-independent transporter DctM subunit
MFIAGVVPGIIIAFGFVAMIFLLATFAPGYVYDLEKRMAGNVRTESREMPTREMVSKLVPIALLVALVLGGLYTGFFTPTEAGGIGAFGALVIALARRSLGGGRMWRVLTETGSVSVGILILLIAAGYYSRMLSMAGVPNAIGDLVQSTGLGAYGFLFVFIMIILFLGMFLDSSSILLIMCPIAVPIAQNFGFDLIHFGIITVVAVEIGLLTPPFGISVFTVKSTLGDTDISVEMIFAGAMPYIAVMLIALVFIALFPALSLMLL